MEQLEEWVRGLKCPEGHKKPTIHWSDWFVVTPPLGNGAGKWRALTRRGDIVCPGAHAVHIADSNHIFQTSFSTQEIY
jgi:hypothetical protein